MDYEVRRTDYGGWSMDLHGTCWLKCRYCLMLRCCGLIFMFLFSGVVQAQEHAGWMARNKDSISWFGNVFNVGLNAGIGGGRLNQISPMPEFKLGTVTLNYLAYDDLDRDVFQEAFELHVDVFTWNRYHPKRRDYLTASGGFTFNYDQSKPVHDYEFFFLGIKHYQLNTRWSFAAKGGWANKWTSVFDPVGYYWNHSSKQIMYGEVSASYSMFKFKRKHHLSKAELKLPFARIFNPYLSLGFGTDKAFLCVPAGGLKIFGFSGQFSFFDANNLALQFQLDLPRSRMKENAIAKPTIGVNILFIDYDIIVGGTIGTIRYKMDQNKSIYTRFGLGVGESGPLPFLSFGMNLHAFKFSKDQFFWNAKMKLEKD